MGRSVSERGALVLYFLLVVSGPERRNIRMDERARDYGITPWGGDFFTWYETWLGDRW